MSAQDIGIALKGRRNGNGWLVRCPCPNHGRGRGIAHRLSPSRMEMTAAYCCAASRGASSSISWKSSSIAVLWITAGRHRRAGPRQLSVVLSSPAPTLGRSRSGRLVSRRKRPLLMSISIDVGLPAATDASLQARPSINGGRGAGSKRQGRCDSADLADQQG